MRLFRYFNILFLCSLVLMYPMVQENNEIVLLPDTPIQIDKIVNTPKLVIKLKEQGTVTLNISKVNLNDNLTQVHLTSQSFNSKLEIKFDKPGVYLFSFQSDKINTIIIEHEGIFLSHVLIILLVGIVNVGLYLLLRNKSKL